MNALKKGMFISESSSEMKNTFLFLLLFLNSILISAQSKNEIIWKDGERLSWNDFQGKPEPRFAAASTTYKLVAKIGTEENNSIFIIHAVFFKKESWKKKKWISESVLRHEQTHLDIVELFARKLRERTSNINGKTHAELEKIFLATYAQTDKEMDELQDLYDKETDGSMNGEKQKEWEMKIKSEIEALGNYKKAKVSLSPTQ